MPLAMTVWLLVVVTAAYGAPTVRNQLRLHRFADQLFEYPLPPKSVEYARHASVSNRIGTGNHCDYYAELTLLTDATDDELAQHHGGLTLRHAARWRRPGVLTDGGFGGLRLERLGPAAEGGDLVRVSVTDSHYPSGLDILCN